MKFQIQFFDEQICSCIFSLVSSRKLELKISQLKIFKLDFYLLENEALKKNCYYSSSLYFAPSGRLDQF